MAMPPVSDAVFVGSPVLNRLLDLVRRGSFLGGAFRQGNKLVVRGEAERDDLADSETGIKRFAGKKVMAEVLLGANRPVLGFEGKDAAEKEQEQEAYIQNYDQRGAVQAVVVADGVVEVD